MQARVTALPHEKRDPPREARIALGSRPRRSHSSRRCVSVQPRSFRPRLAHGAALLRIVAIPAPLPPRVLTDALLPVLRAFRRLQDKGQKAAEAAATPAGTNRKPSTGGVAAAAKTPAVRPGGSAGAQKGGAQATPAARDEIEPLPSFKDTPAGERQALFIRKLRLCSYQMDFTESDKARDKEIKRLNLLEIMDYINTTKGVFNESTFEEITAMISANLFRGLAPNNSPPHAQYDPDEDEPVLEASWPHLQYVYEFLLRFVVSNETDPKVVKRYAPAGYSDNPWVHTLACSRDAQCHLMTLHVHVHVTCRGVLSG